MAKKSRRMASGRRGKVGRAAATGTRRPALFTAAELKLLAQSEGVALEKASRSVVQGMLQRVRGLRDKWRDLFGRQARKEKRSPQAVAQANARSREKSELLHRAVQRLEERLAAFSGQTGTQPAPRRPLKKSSRVATHRTARASVRAALAQETVTLNELRPRKPAEKPAKRPAEVPAKAEAAAPASGKPAGARRRPRAPVVASLGTSLGAVPQAIRFDRSQQRSARAKAKHARLAIKGVSTRRGGHTLASGKRAQARRDKRPR